MFAAATLWNDLLNHFRTENSFNHPKSWFSPGMAQYVVVLHADNLFSFLLYF
jgi:hypothetical protein